VRISYRNVYLKFRKAIWGLLGGTTAAGVIAIANALGYELDPGLASLIAAVAAGLATKQAKPNVDLPTRVLSAKTTAQPTPEDRRQTHGDSW
jgi:hypothetical protein